MVFERNTSSSRFYFCPDNDKGTTYYFGGRNNHNDIMVLYSDKKSKVAPDKHCVHLELRLSGSKILKNHGIYAIQDLVAFRHESIWEQYLDLRDVNYTELGHLATSGESDLSGSSLIRRGHNLSNQYYGLQELLMDNPDFTSATSPIKNRRMFESRLVKALN